MQRIGVFVCHCGTNIAGTVDVKAVAEALKYEPGVVISTEYQYMCSQAGQDLIKGAFALPLLAAFLACYAGSMCCKYRGRRLSQIAGAVFAAAAAASWRKGITVMMSPSEPASMAMPQ